MVRKLELVKFQENDLLASIHRSINKMSKDFKWDESVFSNNMFQKRVDDSTPLFMFESFSLL